VLRNRRARASNSEEGLTSDKRKYPIQQFKAFWAVTKRYAELTRSDPLIHRSVAEAVNGLADFLEAKLNMMREALARLDRHANERDGNFITPKPN
jgi:hypothetical protein